MFKTVLVFESSLNTALEGGLFSVVSGLFTPLLCSFFFF